MKGNWYTLSKRCTNFKLQSNNVPQGVSVNINRFITINIDFFSFVSKINSSQQPSPLTIIFRQ